MSRTEQLVKRGYSPVQVALYYAMRKQLRAILLDRPLEYQDVCIRRSEKTGKFFKLDRKNGAGFNLQSEHMTLTWLIDRGIDLGCKVDFTPHKKPITPLNYFHHAIYEIKDLLQDLPSDGMLEYSSDEYGTWRAIRLGYSDQYRLENSHYPEENNYTSGGYDIARDMVKKDLFPVFNERLWFTSANDLERYVNDSGSDFFSKGTMKAFDSKLYPHVWQGIYFVTSEKHRVPASMIFGTPAYSLPRKWTIRYLTAGASIKEVLDFETFDTEDEAIEVLNLLTSEL